MSHVVIAIIEKTDPVPSYLLVNSQKDFGQFTDYYYPPGGHVETGEDEITALKREVKEELQLDINQFKKITDTPGDIKNQITSWYLCKVENYELKIDQNELKNAGFFTKEEILNMKIWPATLSIFQKNIF